MSDGGQRGFFRLVAVLGLMVASLFIVRLCFRSDAVGEREGTFAENVAGSVVALRNQERTHEPYVAGVKSRIDPNAPGNDDKDFLAANDHASRTENADLGPAQSGSAQAIVDNSETLRQGAAFADLPTQAERLAASNARVDWDSPDENTWLEDTSLDDFESIQREEYVALNDMFNDGFVPLTQLEDGKPYSSIPIDQQAFLNTNSLEERNVPLSESDGDVKLKKSVGNLETNDHAEMTQTAAVKLSSIEVPSDYSPTGVYVDSGNETLGQGSTPF